MSLSPTIQKLSSSTALVTVGDVEAWEKRRKALIQQRSEIDLELAGLDQKIAFFQPMIWELAASTSRQRDDSPALPELPEPAKPTETPAIKLRAHANISAIDAFRRITLRIGRESPQGFTSQQVFRAFKDDPQVDPRVKEVNEGYLYHVMRRFAAERLIVRISARGYTLAELVEGAGPGQEGTVVETEDGYKMVPMTKEELIRQGVTKYLLARPNKTAHRAAIADWLCAPGRPFAENKRPVHALSTYLARWPQFVADGDGNYTLKEDLAQ